MIRRLGTLSIESIAPESAKFTAPMLLLHGMWCTAAAWRRFMGYLAHRGWSCHALNLHGHVRFADCLDGVRQAIAACEAPPVLLGHDLGALLALHCAATTRAVVALAPLVPQPLRSQPHPAFRTFRSRLAMWRGRSLPAPRGKLARDCFGSPPERPTPDSATLAREVSRIDLRFPITRGVPLRIVAGAADVVSPVSDVERLARYAGATLQQVPGAGHGLPWDPGWEHRAGDIHRWLIQQLGEALLVIREEEE